MAIDFLSAGAAVQVADGAVVMLFEAWTHLLSVWNEKDNFRIHLHGYGPFIYL